MHPETQVFSRKGSWPCAFGLAETEATGRLGNSISGKLKAYENSLPVWWQRHGELTYVQQLDNMSADPPDEKEEKVRALDEDDIALLKTYGQGPYSVRIKDVEKDVKEIVKKVNDVSGIKESETGLAPPSRWDLVSDKQAMQEEQPLQVRIERQACAVAGSGPWIVSNELSSNTKLVWLG